MCFLFNQLVTLLLSIAKKNIPAYAVSKGGEAVLILVFGPENISVFWFCSKGFIALLIIA